ncbi:MAG: porin family protein [Muribaculaceae bacterium]|nr:porin family protein [Muribaculaceae bacterium]
MKKLIALFMFVALGINAYADKGDVTVGVHLYDNPKVDPNLFGGGVSVLYNFSDHFRGKAIASVISGSDVGCGVDAAVELQWGFNLGERFVLYPAIGGGYLNIDGLSGASFLIGPGCEYYINDNWGIGLDIRGQIMSEGAGLPITLGVTYTF